jgi:hypothetical protein
MRSRSHKFLKSASLLVCIISVLLFVFSQVVTVAARRVQVRDKEGHIIGEAWIPHDYGTNQFLSMAIMIMSGIQLWTIVIIGRSDDAEQK